MKTKTRKELEEGHGFWKVLAVLLIISFVLLSIVSMSDQSKINKLEQQLSECQDKLPETQWSCPVLLEKGMYSLRDSGVLISPSGKELKCEVLE